MYGIDLNIASLERYAREKHMTTKNRLAAVLFVGAILSLAWFAYAPALSSVYVLDDRANLSGLDSVRDTMSALKFIFSGIAGPLGRPIALATFVPQAAAWGETAEPFVRVNILIHLINACLLTWVLRLLTIASGIRKSDGVFVVVAGATIWLFMPLLASASLMIIQRMTTLSALFVLLGLGSYLWARQALPRNPTTALIGMTTALVLGTLFAAFTKENGALLVVYALVMEATLLQRPDNLNRFRWNVWKCIFLVLPTALILAYLATRLPYSDQTVLRRGFTGWERLMTESRILWEYLANALVPRAGTFGPFHDGYPVARNLTDPVTFLAVSSWIVISALALIWRRRYPLFAFAALWFLGGHLIESTTVQLLLYFEHRNYLPIIGPIFALCAIIVKVPESRKRLMYAGATTYVLLSVFVLFGLSSLWGNPAQAFPYWQQRSPHSMFAATAALEIQLLVEGPESVRKAVRNMVAAKPEVGYLAIYGLRLSCTMEPRKDHSAQADRLQRSLRHVKYSATTVRMLQDLLEEADNTACNGVDSSTVKRLAESVIANPEYSVDALYNQRHHQLMALIAQLDGNVGQAIRHLERAIEYKPSPELNKMMVVTYVAENDFDAARGFVDDARRNPPGNPMKRFVWLQELRELTRYIDRVEAVHASKALPVAAEP